MTLRSDWVSIVTGMPKAKAKEMLGVRDSVAQRGLELLDRLGFAEKVSLKRIAAIFHQHFELVFCLNALGDAINPKMLSHGYNCLNDCTVLTVDGNVVNKGLIDFEFLDWEFF